MRIDRGLFGAACVMAFVYGCTDNGGASLFARHAIQVSQQNCDFSDSGPALSRGDFDPTGAQDYRLALLLQNNLTDRQNAVTGIEGTDNIRLQTNEINIVGFDACWYIPDEVSGAFGSNDSGRLEDCTSDAVRNTRAFIPSSGRIPAGEGAGVAEIAVLTRAQLRTLFGEEFDPDVIPERGLYPVDNDRNGDTDGSVDNNFSFTSEDPSSPSRSPAWGTYPPERSVRIVLQLRAVGEPNGAFTVKSNWFAFNIDVCMGCINAQCGDLTQVICEPTACGGGAPCQNSRCSDGSECVGFSNCPDGSLCPVPTCPDNVVCRPQRQAFVGQVSNFAQSCLPFQRGQLAVCDPFDGCVDNTQQ